MKEIDATIRAAIRVVKARREARRAAEDGASEQAQKKYGAAFSKALDELERALDALAKKQPKPATQAAPFDWGGLAKSALALARLVRKVQGRPISQVVDVIDAEVID
ncbi:MAG: hypothetical protein ACRCSL_16765 [Microbacterium sp.]